MRLGSEKLTPVSSYFDDFLTLLRRHALVLEARIGKISAHAAPWSIEPETPFHRPDLVLSALEKGFV